MTSSIPTQPGRQRKRSATRHSLRCSIGGLFVAVLLGACSSLPSSVNPVAWWHDLEGGAIAEQRPPPPGATDPYPNLATVPGKPAPADPGVRRQIAESLVSDRTNAQREAAAA